MHSIFRLSTFSVSRRTFIRSLPFVVSIVSILIGLLITWVISTTLDEFAASAAFPTLLSIFLFLLVDRVCTDYLSETNMALIGDRFSEVKELIQSGHQITNCGPPERAVQAIAISVQHASNVWNTYFHFGIRHGVNYGLESQAIIADAMDKMLSRGNTKWTDIISSADFNFKNRITKLKNIISKRESSYDCYQLRNQCPHLNFMVIEFGGRELSEVFFGFGWHSHDQIGEVFHTRNEKIVEMFRRLHGSLRSDSYIIEDLTTFIPKRESMIDGIWRSVAFYVDGKLSDVAYVEIRQIKNTASFKGFIFSCDGRLTGWFNSAIAYLVDNKMVFLYYRVVAERITTDVKAIGVYDFGDEKNFIGKLMPVNDAAALSLKGVRANPDEIKLFEARDWENLGKYVEEHSHKWKNRDSASDEIESHVS